MTICVKHESVHLNEIYDYFIENLYDECIFIKI